MQLLDVSPNARSVQYKCAHCGRKLIAEAGSAAASEARDLWTKASELVDQLARRGVHVTMTFTTPIAPLPYEQTRREPIPADVRAEVWRRDGGRCVECGSNQDLQFDHVIPVATGGATSTANLQLLCRQHNLSKGAKI